MEYQNLRIISYADNTKYLNEYKKRFEGITTFQTGLSIVPFSLLKGERLYTEKYELFYVPIKENLLLEDQIYRNSKKIEMELTGLPLIAQKKLLFTQIINEVQSNNEIEGVRSTRKELNEAAKFKGTKKHIRFKGIVTQYLNIGDDKYERIKEAGDFRKIFDNLFKGDMDKEDLPDGKMFRKDVVFIQDEKQNIHQGAANEDSIVKDLKLLITFMNSHAFPLLLKAAITHYFFEYIHPFYDGNGRMGRFILSSYLARKLDQFTGISISNAVRENRKKYLDIFTEVSNPKNKGEMTFFVKTIYELIIEGQQRILSDLLEYKARFNHAENYLKNLSTLNEEEKELIYIYIQQYIFDELNDLEDQEVADTIGFSRYLLNKRLDSLIEKDTLVQIQKNPSVHVLSQEFLENLERN